LVDAPWPDPAEQIAHVSDRQSWPIGDLRKPAHGSPADGRALR